MGTFPKDIVTMRVVTLPIKAYNTLAGCTFENSCFSFRKSMYNKNITLEACKCALNVIQTSLTCLSCTVIKKGTI